MKLTYSNAEALKEHAETVFKVHLQFDSVEILENYTKDAMIEEFEKLQKLADDFDGQGNTPTVFVIAIVWIGFKISNLN